MKQETSLHIAELHIANIKRIRAFAVGLDGEKLLLTGDNGAGKSSVLDAIFLALTGKGLEDPIRKGSSKASIKLVLNGAEEEYTIEKRITPKGRTLVVTTKDGTPIPSPQAFLDGLIGSLAFDPLEFVRMGRDAKGRREQAATIRELSGLDTSALDVQRKQVFDRRTSANASLKTAEAQFKALSLPVIPEGEDEIEASASALIAKRDAMQVLLKKHEDAEDTATEFAAKRDGTLARIVELEKQLAAERETLTLQESECKKADEAAEAALKLRSTNEELAAITTQIGDVDSINAGIRQRREAKAAALRAQHAYEQQKATVSDAQTASDNLTAQLEAMDAKKKAMTDKATMPVDGMSFDDDGVQIGGVRFDQLSTAEQIRTSAMVAMAANPKLRIILIREGALVNSSNMQVIVDAAKDKDYQLLIEKFATEPGNEGLFIEDGEVTHIDGVKQTPEAEPTETITLEGEE